MANIRTWHTYLGLLIAPSILFFALSGALQIFRFHEAHGDYQPPLLLEKLSRVHKDQVFAPDEHHEHAGDHAPAGAKEGGDADPDHEGAKGDEEHEHEGNAGTVLLKWYFLIVAVALTTSTCLGLWIGLRHVRHKRIGWVLVVIGTVLPTLLIAL
jgi:hypothetical protein